MGTEPRAREYAPDPYTTAAVHAAADQLLHDVLAYLDRLPPHPMTSELANRVRVHLNDPTAGVVRQHVAKLAAAEEAERLARHGDWRFLPNGLSALLVSVSGDRAVVQSPAAATFGSTAHGREFAQQLSKDLARGVEVRLLPRGEKPK